MKKLFLFLGFIITFQALFAVDGENILQNIITKESLKDNLVMNQAWVSYPSYADRQGWDKHFSDNKAAVISFGEKCLDYQWKVVPAMAYMAFELTGDRNSMQTPYNQNMSAYQALIFAELAEGKGRFIPQIVNGTMAFCEMTSWALSAHLALYSYAKRSLPVFGDNTLELTEGDLSNMLSWSYYFFKSEFDKLNPEISRRLRAELEHRELDSYLTRNDFWWMGIGDDKTKKLNNWTPWCNYNALCSFMLLENDRDRLCEAVWKSIVSNDEYLNRLQSDGGIEEGPSYWGHSAGKLFEYLYALNLITGGKYDLFRNPRIKAMGEYYVNAYIGDKWLANFADATAIAGFSGYPLVYAYGKAFNSELMMDFARMCYGKASSSIAAQPGGAVLSYLDKINNCKEVAQRPEKFKPLDYCWYDVTEFHFSRNESGLTLAAKGGYNDESHNHNDIGTFNLYIDNQPVIIDVGVGTYTKFTFSEKRYDIWTMQGQYHNVPMVNGIQQAFGKEYKASACQSSKGHFSLELSSAYPEEAKISSWVRSYDMKDNTLTINDKFKLNEALDNNCLTFMTWGEIAQPQAGKITISVCGVKALLEYDARRFDCSVDTVNLDDPRISGVWGDKVFRIRLVAKTKSLKGNYQCKISKM